ncbi:hypothetical protein BV22DRAFT_1197199 [Leucogyrophana mollusca]|uniref:Uncharacterized protein n=1 Tax=Leucogyrophana mollusca TaxID=85980 RepID=A0ACB8BD53_9AGAM|nr:hypothetical protein BV22DRAFT_1197199 [Leucogyrophana mollusca]
MDKLDPPQVEIVGQLQAISNGHDTEVLISVLESVGWDIQKAAEFIFDGDLSTNRPIITPVAAFDVDDSQQSITPAGQNVSRSHNVGHLRTMWDALISIFAMPIHLLSSLLRFTFSTLRIPFPPLHFAGANSYRALRPSTTDPRNAADRWIRALEEETGAFPINCSRSPAAVVTGAHAGPSTSRRHAYIAENLEDSARVLPDFFSGSYEDVLDICQRDGRVACIILVSEEHDDVAEFKRSTLTDPAFVKTMHDNNFVVWGGDIRDRDAWSASQKLQATTYPFIAFLALQPRRNHSPAAQSNSSPILTTLSRHQGRSVPDTAPTSARSLVQHLEQQLLPRVTPFLTRHKTLIQERERDRILREEQDRAFKDSARRDSERVAAKIHAERLEAERQQRQQAETREKEERHRMEQERREKYELLRMDWRRWMRKSLVPSSVATSGPSVRIAVRLPDNERVVRAFSPSSTLTALYAYADSKLIPSNLRPEDDPEHAPSTGLDGIDGLDTYIQRHSDGPTAWWGFKLALAYPRREIKWEASKCLRDIDGLQDGGQVVVELHNGGRVSSPNDASDDEYDTESD